MRIAVYGSSLYMASLAASLKACPDLEIVRIPAASEALTAHFRDLAPTVVAIDLDEAPAELPISLLRQIPGLLVLGVDPNSDDLLVLAGHSASALSATDLAQIIRERALPQSHTSTCSERITP